MDPPPAPPARCTGAPPRPRCRIMEPAAGGWAQGLWRACNWLMGAFFALAAFVQVSGPGQAAGKGRRAPSSASRSRAVWTNPPAGSQGRAIYGEDGT